MANYLELQDLVLIEARAIFQFRSRIANFKENYKGTNQYSVCSLCQNHPDTQQAAFLCSVIRRNVDIQGNYRDILDGNITKELATTIINITKFRETSPMEAQTCTG